MTTTTTPRLERGTYIGGHEIGAITGIHPYMGPLEVYAACSLGKRRDISNEPAVRRGKIIEPGLMDHVEGVIAAERAPSVVDMRRDLFIVDADVPYFAGTIDIAEMRDGVPHHLHELTSTTSRSLDMWGPDGSDNGAAPYKWVQLQWYMGNSGAQSGTIWLFVADTGEIRRYHVARNDTAIAQLRNDGEAFWLDHVLSRRVPDMPERSDVGGRARAAGSLDLIYKGDPDAVADPTEELVAAANDYDAARAAIDAAEKAKAAAAGTIKAILKDATRCKWDGGHVSWTRNKPSSKTDLESLVARMTARFELDPTVVSAMRAEDTTSTEGPRVLRVTIKSGNKGK